MKRAIAMRADRSSGTKACFQAAPGGGFTLIELLVTLGIIVLLASILFPGYRIVLTKAQGAKCASNLKQFYLAAEGWSMDHNGMSLPAQTQFGDGNGNPDPNNKLSWNYILRPFLGASSEYDDSMDAKFRCPAYKKTSPKDQPNGWAMGYGMNSNPGYEGAASTNLKKRFNWEERNIPIPTTWQGTFASVIIESKSKRLLFCDAVEWQVNPASTAAGIASKPDYNRHGSRSCNMVFYDGHVEAVKSDRLSLALYDPAKL